MSGPGEGIGYGMGGSWQGIVYDMSGPGQGVGYGMGWSTSEGYHRPHATAVHLSDFFLSEILEKNGPVLLGAG